MQGQTGNHETKGKTMTITWKGSTGYHVSKAQLSYLKKAGKLSGNDWKCLAAQPTAPFTAFLLLKHGEGVAVADALDAWLESPGFADVVRALS